MRELWTLEHPGEEPEPAGESLRSLCPKLPDWEAYTHQVETAEEFHDGKNVLLTAGTGGGKTEAALGAVWGFLPAVFVYPTKALARDQFERLRGYGFDVVIADGDHPEWRHEIENAEIVLTNPQMLWTHAKRNGEFWKYTTTNTQAIVWDEVHFYGPRLSNKLLGLARALRDHRHLFMSATVGRPERFAREVEKVLGSPVVYVRGKGRFAPRVYRALRPRGESDVLEMLERFALDDDMKTIVYARGRSHAERLVRSLKKRGLPVAYHHGTLPREERERVEVGFRDGGLRMVVTVKTLEVGIDVGEVGRIVHLGLPPRVSDFLQREGRAGRRGEPAESCLVVSSDHWSAFVLRSRERFERAYLEGELESIQARAGSVFSRPPAESGDEGFYGGYERSRLPRDFVVRDADTGRVLRDEVSRDDVIRYYAPGALFEHSGRTYAVLGVDVRGRVGEVVAGDPGRVGRVLEGMVEAGWWTAVLTGVALEGGSVGYARGWVVEYWDKTILVPPPDGEGRVRRLADPESVGLELSVRVDSFYAAFREPRVRDRAFRDAMEFALHVLTKALAIVEGYPMDGFRHFVDASRGVIIVYEAPAAVMPYLDWEAVFEEARDVASGGVELEELKLPRCPWPWRDVEVDGDAVMGCLDRLEEVLVDGSRMCSVALGGGPDPGTY